jgi:hypothetical protein
LYSLQNHNHPRLFWAILELNFGGSRSMLYDMQAIGYVRVSTDRQAEQGVSLEAQEAKIRAMSTVQGAELAEVIVDGGESAKSLNRPGLQRLLAMVSAGKVEAVIVAELDRLTRSVKDLCGLLELFEKRKVALISVAEALDTGSRRGKKWRSWRAGRGSTRLLPSKGYTRITELSRWRTGARVAPLAAGCGAWRPAGSSKPWQ